jgi:hypothetical protein
VHFFGLIGVAIGTVLPAVFFNFVILPAKITKKFNITVMEYYRKCLGKPFLLGLGFVAVLAIARKIFGCNTWMNLIVGLLSSVGIYAVLVYIFDLRQVLANKGLTPKRAVIELFRNPA